MRTTIDVPDSLFRAMRIHAAERNLTLKEVAIAALRRYLGQDEKQDEEKPWMKFAGAGKHLKEDIEAVQKYIDEELSQIDEDEWK